MMKWGWKLLRSDETGAPSRAVGRINLDGRGLYLDSFGRSSTLASNGTFLIIGTFGIGVFWGDIDQVLRHTGLFQPRSEFRPKPLMVMPALQ